MKFNYRNFSAYTDIHSAEIGFNWLPFQYRNWLEFAKLRVDTDDLLNSEVQQHNFRCHFKRWQEYVKTVDPIIFSLGE